MPRPGGAGRQPPPRASSSGLSNHSTVWLILEKSSFNFSTHPFTWQNTILFYCILLFYFILFQVPELGGVGIWSVEGIDGERGTEDSGSEGPCGGGGGCILHGKRL